MLRTTTIAVALACSAILAGCAADTTTTDQNTPSAAEPLAFMLWLDEATTAETVIPAIVTAGHAELTAACKVTPSGSIRITNPLASGAFEYVSCTSVLSGEETAATSAALSSEPGGERSGEARQPLTPIGGVLCGLASLIATTAAANECKKWRGPNSQFCGVGGMYSGAAWILACYVMF